MNNFSRDYAAIFNNNLEFEKKNKKIAIDCCKEYAAKKLRCDFRYIKVIEATEEENKKGTDIYCIDITTNKYIRIDFKVRREEVEKYWNGVQDVALENIQNGKQGWVKDDKDVHVVWVYPWISKSNHNYLRYYGCHMDVCKAMLDKCIDENRSYKKTHGTNTTFYPVSIKDMKNCEKQLNSI